MNKQQRLTINNFRRSVLWLDSFTFGGATFFSTDEDADAGFTSTPFALSSVVAP